MVLFSTGIQCTMYEVENVRFIPSMHMTQAGPYLTPSDTIAFSVHMHVMNTDSVSKVVFLYSGEI